MTGENGRHILCQEDKQTPPYPSRVVNPKYSADDVFLQVSGDELHLDGSVAVDSVFRPVLWTQLNRTDTFRRKEMQTNQHAGRENKAKKQNKNMDDLLVSGSKSVEVIFIS